MLIAFAAASQTILSYYILQIPINIYVVSLEWSSTLLLYNFSLWLSMPKVLGTSPYPRTKWYFEHKTYIASISFLAALTLMYSVLQLHAYSFYLLALVGVLSLGYGLPIVRSKVGFVSLRQIVGLKVFLIAIVWALSTVGLPAVEYISTGGNLELGNVVTWAGLMCLFILGITLPFDIRDMKQDSLYRLKTIPLLIGGNNAKKLCYLLIGIHSFCIVLLPNYFIFEKESLLFADILVLLFFYVFLFREKSRYKDVYVLDLLLIIQMLSVIIWITLQ